MIRQRAWLAFGALGAALACSGTSEQPQVEKSKLPPGSVARVGGELVATESVARAAARQGLLPREALARTISDALLAHAARQSLPEGMAGSIERVAAARALLEQLAAAARAAGPASDAELAQLLSERWPELDRPDAALISHAVVLLPKDDPEQEAAALQVAERVAQATARVTSAEEFLREAKAVPSAGLELRAEQLPPLTRDGRSFNEQGDKPTPGAARFDETFAAAALALQKPGQLSPIVKTRFGFHVIRLERLIPGKSVPRAELRARLADDVHARRGADARRALLTKLRSAARLETDRAADELTSRAKTAP